MYICYGSSFLWKIYYYISAILLSIAFAPEIESSFIARILILYGLEDTMVFMLTVPGVSVIEFTTIDMPKSVVCLVCMTLKIAESIFDLKFHTFFIIHMLDSITCCMIQKK